MLTIGKSCNGFDSPASDTKWKEFAEATVVKARIKELMDLTDSN